MILKNLAQKAITVKIKNQAIQLLPQRCIYWPAERTLLLSDVHLGKSSHFRKAGLPVPGTIAFADLGRIGNLIKELCVARVIFLGDLFHSDINREWLLLENFMEDYSSCEFILIKGNHDILPEAVYRQSRLKIVEEEMVIFPFLLTHHPPETRPVNNDLYTLCGHIHPAVLLKGKGNQQQKLACFYFGLHYGILPAFGKFTGFHKIKVSATDSVFGVLPEKVVCLQLGVNCQLAEAM